VRARHPVLLVTVSSAHMVAIMFCMSSRETFRHIVTHAFSAIDICVDVCSGIMPFGIHKC